MSDEPQTWAALLDSCPLSRRLLDHPQKDQILFVFRSLAAWYSADNLVDLISTSDGYDRNTFTWTAVPHADTNEPMLHFSISLTYTYKYPACITCADPNVARIIRLDTYEARVETQCTPAAGIRRHHELCIGTRRYTIRHTVHREEKSVGRERPLTSAIVVIPADPLGIVGGEVRNYADPTPQRARANDARASNCRFATRSECARSPLSFRSASLTDLSNDVFDDTATEDVSRDSLGFNFH